MQQSCFGSFPKQSPRAAAGKCRTFAPSYIGILATCHTEGRERQCSDAAGSGKNPPPIPTAIGPTTRSQTHILCPGRRFSIPNTSRSQLVNANKVSGCFFFFLFIHWISYRKPNVRALLPPFPSLDRTVPELSKPEAHEPSLSSPLGLSREPISGEKRQGGRRPDPSLAHPPGGPTKPPNQNQLLTT